MEYCPYGSLKEHVEQNGHLTLHEAQFVFKQLVSALEHIHRNGLLYRNLEPAHVLISNINEDGEIFVKLCDFGASRPMKREGLMQPSEDFTALAKVLFYSITGWNFVNSPDVYDKLAVFSETAADLIRQLMINNSNFGFEDIKSHKFYRFNFSHDETFSKEELESSFRVEEDHDLVSSYDNSDDESLSVHADEMEWTDFERENRTPEAPLADVHFNADFPPRRSEILPNNQPLLLPQPNVLHIPTGPGGDYTSQVLDSPQSTEAQAEDVSPPNSRANSSMGVVSFSEPAHSAIEIDESEIRMSPCDTVCTHELAIPLQSNRNVQSREKKRFFLFNWIIGIFRWFFRC
ncbi:hypothetical protein M3Y94_00902000 [Aphelenchoides besseyi]|nr:hypothetical protein M3Y94_00902000 [Aphelenchoides besseyi]